MSTTRYIDVYVKAKLIYDLGGIANDAKRTLRSDEIDRCTNLIYRDSNDELVVHESDYTYKHADFSVEVNRGDTIEWSIRLHTSGAKVTSGETGFTVELVSVNHEPNPPTNPNFFTKNSLTPEPSDKHILGSIPNNSGLVGQSESYNITFNVTNPNKVSRQFIIDPKLKINS